MTKPEPGSVPAAPSSRLASLRDRRKAATQSLHVDLEVPRYDPPIYVRFRPVEDHEIEKVNKTAEKSKDPQKSVVANAVVLAQACVGVFEVVDGEEVSVDPDDREGEWPKFDEKLAELLDYPVQQPRASDVVRQLYLTDGDLIATATKLATWSGYNLQQIEERDAGN